MRILIAEDDRAIQKGLSIMIDGFGNDFKVVGTAPNGQIALEVIERLKPDVLITDIKMPIMDGNELTRRLRESGIPIKIIVLSGYDNYKYVRESMKNGAVDYLLKPVENQELFELLMKVKSQFEIEKQKNITNSMITLNESKEILRERFFEELIESKLNDIRIEQRVKQLGIKPVNDYVVAAFDIDNYHKIKKVVFEGQQRNIIEVLKEEIKWVFGEGILGDKMLLHARENPVVLLLILMDGQDALESFYNLLVEIKDKICAKYMITVTLGVSETSKTLNSASNAYNQAICAAQRRFYTRQNSLILYCRDVCSYPLIDIEDCFSDSIHDLIRIISIGDIQSAKGCLETIYDKIIALRIAPDDCRSVLTSIVNSVSMSSNDFREAMRKCSHEESDFAYQIDATDTFDELIQYLIKAFCTVIDCMNQIKGCKRKKVIEIAKDYIKKHYNENISLKSVAEHVYLNSTYFSELFKVETGQNFIDYLMDTRISEAKRLLSRPEIKVYEVGQMVGYNEPVSFSRAFKKVVGMSPNKYKKDYYLYTQQ